MSENNNKLTKDTEKSVWHRLIRPVKITMEKLDEAKLERDVRDGVKVDRVRFVDFVAKLMERINPDVSSNLMDKEHFSIVTFRIVLPLLQGY